MALQLAKELNRPWELARAGIRTNFELIEVAFNRFNALHASDNIETLSLVIDDGGGVLTTGVKGFIFVPVASTITAIRVLSVDGAATAGSAVLDLWRNTYANYPPIVDNSIVASAKPTLVSTNKYQDTTLTGWTKTMATSDIIAVNLDSVSTFTRLLVLLTVAR